MTTPTNAPGITLHLAPASLAIIRRALHDRINLLHATAGEVIRVSGADGAGKVAAAPLLDEAREVGVVLDEIQGEM